MAGSAPDTTDGGGPTAAPVALFRRDVVDPLAASGVGPLLVLDPAAGLADCRRSARSMLCGSPPCWGRRLVLRRLLLMRPSRERGTAIGRCSSARSLQNGSSGIAVLAGLLRHPLEGAEVELAGAED